MLLALVSDVVEVKLNGKESVKWGIGIRNQ